MPSLNDPFSSRLDTLGIRIPALRLPAADSDLARWAVVACDQYTSDPAYWTSVQQGVGQAASTLHLVLPEIYLESSDVPDRIKKIHASMDDYLKRGVLLPPREAIVYVRRTTEASGLREGFVVSVDLERYDYSPDSKSLIRATEGTIVDRIPPRLAVRSKAPLELPHIMVLVQDPESSLIESWGARTAELSPLYDVELMSGGGHLQGFAIEKPEHLEQVISCLEGLLATTVEQQKTDSPLFWAMGDGNHSLATAKANWVAVKKELLAGGESEASVLTHPARFALVEVVNIHSTGLRFEPIHRAVFTTEHRALLAAFQHSEALQDVAPIAEDKLIALLESPEGQDKLGYYDGTGFHVATCRANSGLPSACADRVFAQLHAKYSDARIDFIHGWEDTKKLATEGARGFFLPVLARERLFGYVENNGPLPRKSFSMGDAEEKRYYLETRQINREK